MHRAYGVVVVVLGLFFGSCAGVRVLANFEKGTDFSQYKTFSFSPMRSADETTEAFSVEHQEWLNEAITRELKKRNYHLVGENADLMVSNYLSVEKKFRGTSFSGAGPYAGGYYGNYYGYSRGSYKTVEYREGTLVIDLVDQKQNKLVWQGIGFKTMTGRVERPREKINGAVEKIFSKFPVKVATTAH